MGRKINRHSPEYVVWYKEGKKIWLWKANMLKKNSTDVTQASADIKADMDSMAVWFRFVVIILSVLLALSIGWNIYLYIY